jgi:hypothetical protein
VRPIIIEILINMWHKKRKSIVYIFWLVMSVILILSMIGFIIFPLFL